MTIYPSKIYNIMEIKSEKEYNSLMADIHAQMSKGEKFLTEKEIEKLKKNNSGCRSI
jgi:tmRNA-binding protein